MMPYLTHQDKNESGSHRRLTASLSRAGAGLWVILRMGIIAAVLLVLHLPATAQRNQFPANVSPVLGLPYSMFLSDYTDDTRRQLTANIVFNDFNEPFWTFRLKLRIVHNDLLIETRPDFIPSQPITVTPGEPVQLVGSDWVEYLDYRNLSVRGPAAETFRRTNRFPEGMFTIYLQVLDYETGEALSAESLMSWWMTLYNPPLWNVPQPDVYINPGDPFTNFSWQLFDLASLNNLGGPEYQFTLWEITEQDAQSVDPLSAVQNGQALQIYQSDLLMTPNLVYGPTEPTLDPGKAYIYRVQAFDPLGRDSFKNQGFSEFRRFYYGWPRGGKINLRYPEDEFGFTKEDPPSLLWDHASNLLPLQPVEYEIRVAKKDFPGETAETALNGELWHYYKTSEEVFLVNYLAHDLGYVDEVDEYAWEVIGYTGGQEIARSEQQTFVGPPIFEKFYANTHTIFVSTMNNDPNNLSGKGKVRLTEGGELIDVSFDGLKVDNPNGWWSVVEGEILSPTDFTIPLTPSYEDNGPAVFQASQFRLDNDGLSIEGRFEWDLHLASFSDGKAQVVSDPQWFNFDSYYLVGSAPIAAGNTFELLDPYGFTLKLDTASRAHITRNQYTLDFNGYVELPEKVVAVDNDQRVLVPFKAREQIFYLEENNAQLFSPVRAARGSNIRLSSSHWVLDLSDERSPSVESGNPTWKGILFQEYDLSIPHDFDPQRQVVLDSTVTKRIVAGTQADEYAYVGAGGVHLSSVMAFEQGEEVFFNTFPATLEEFVLKVEASELGNSSELKGRAMVPFLSTSDTFPFRVQMTSQGLAGGYFEGLKDYEMVYNEGHPEQEVRVQVRRGVIEEGERLALTIDLQWPAVGVDLQAIRALKVWGNYNVGFYTPEGLFALDQQVTTTYKGQPMTIDGIAVGRAKGLYGFGVTGKVAMGEEVSGEEGAPSLNFYSLQENELLPGTYEPTFVETEGIPGQIDVNQAVADATAEIEAEQASMTDELNVLRGRLELETESEIASAAEALGGVEHLPEDMIEADASGQETERVNWKDRETYIPVVKGVMRVAPSFIPESSRWRVTMEAVANLGDEVETDFVAKLEDIPRQVADEVGIDLSSEVLEPLDRELNKVRDKVVGQVNLFRGGVNGQVTSAVGLVVDNAASEVVNLMSGLGPEVNQVVSDIALSTKQAIILEIQSSLNQSIEDNIVYPVTLLLEDQLLGRAESYIAGSADDLVISTFKPGSNPTNVLGEALSSMDSELAAMGSDVANFLKPDAMAERIAALGSDAITNIDPDRIVGRIYQGAMTVLQNYAAEKIVGAANEVVNQALGESLGVEIPLNVGVAGIKMLSGGGPKDLLADPIKIKHRSRLVDFNGLAHMVEDHPVYGDIFTAAIDVRVKVPDKNNPIAINAAYIHGRKEGLPYWMVEVGGGAAAANPMQQPVGFDAPEGTAQVGEEMSEEKAQPANGIKLGVAEIMALRGRFYKHMSGDGLGAMVPDPQNKWGAYLHMVLFGPKDGEKLRLEIEGSVNTFTDGNLILDLFGDVQMASASPQIGGGDQGAAINGTIEVVYNKHEKHFFGYATVELITEGLCASGSLLVDVKPGAWRVALGNREERINVVPGCVGLSFSGWVDLTSEYVEVGVGLGLAFNKDFDVNMAIVKAGLRVRASLDIFAFASLNYTPLRVREIGVFLEFLASVGVKYQVGVKPVQMKGSVTLLDLQLYASAILRFYPAPRQLYGTLRGKIRVVKVISFDFKKDFSMNF